MKKKITISLFTFLTLFLVYNYNSRVKDNFEDKDVKTSLTKNKDRATNTPEYSATSKKRNVAQVSTKKNEKITKPSTPWLVKASKQLYKIESCYQSNKCKLPNKDPREYDYSVGQKLKKKLYELNSIVLQEKIKDDEISRIGRHFLQIDDGHVKEAALHLIASQEASAESAQSLLDSVISYHDANLIQHAMLELQRYIGQSQEQQINQTLAKEMSVGSPIVAHAISENIDPFINLSNYKSYENNLADLSPQSLTYKQLKVSIDEFKRKSNGG